MRFKIINLIVFFTFCISQFIFSQKINFAKYENVNIEKRPIRVASLSIIPDKWQKEVNWKRIENMVRRAAKEGGAELIVTPEGALEGYVINEVNGKIDSEEYQELLKQFFELGEPLDGKYIKKASTLSKELKIYFILGFLERDQDLLFNTAVLFDPEGDIIGRYRKTHFAQGYKLNPSFYRAGNDFPVFKTSLGNIGILICYDRQLPEPARMLTLNGAEILIAPSYGGYSDENGWNTILLRTRARENGLPLVFTHPFQSLLIRGNGEISEIGNSNDIAYFEINISKDENKVLKNRRPEIYQKLNDNLKSIQ